MENDLTTDLLELESRLDNLLVSVGASRDLQNKVQFFAMRLFNLNSLAEMIDYILGNVNALFDLDSATLCLLDASGEITRLLNEEASIPYQTQGLMLLCDRDALQSTFGPFGYRVHPYLGPCDHAHFGRFFLPDAAPPESIAIIPLLRRGQYFGTLNLGSRRPGRFSGTVADDFTAHLGTVLSICFESRLTIETVRRTSYIDTLTGVNTRRFLEQRIGEELARCHRSNDPLTCLFLDIDYFKSVNDQFGHQAGDRVLSVVANTIKCQLRTNDVLARYGGEEFVALLTNISQAKGFEIAERIRRNVQSLRIPCCETTIPVTLSIGLATYRSDRKHSMTAAEAAVRLIDAADTAMYQAKNKGRNRIECHDISLDQPLALNG